MWLPAEHSDEENLRWAWLRAVEWINWPLFISQPIVPVLLYFFDWSPIVVSAVLISYLWRLVVPQRFVSVGLANLAPSFVLLKFLSCPIMAFLIWQQNDRWGAALALLWPVAIHVIEFPITIIEAVLAGIFPVFKKAQSTMHIGPVQQRFMAALGYTRRTPSPDEVLKEEREKAKEYPLGKESPNLPQWQLDELTQHRRLRQRSSRSADPGKIFWTRTSKGAAVTELDGYWADVAVTEENKFAFTAYSKDSGREVITWFDYETEQQAMHAAVDFMRDGKDPRA